MSNTDFVPSNDATYETWLANFAAKCEVYEAISGLTETQILAMQSQSAIFAASMNELEAAKLALKTTAQTKDLNRKSSTAMARTLAKQIKGAPGITDAILADFGILASSTAGPVVTVTGLDVTGCDDGVNKLKWDRTGNAPGTMFLIETSFDGLTGWELVDVTTKVTYDHIDQIPGQRQFYRIKSKRASTTSPACPPEVVYANGGESGLSLAA